MRKTIGTSVFLLTFLIASLFFIFQKNKVEAPIQWKEARIESLNSLEKETIGNGRIIIETKKTEVEADIPSEKIISVPFTSQAPQSVWDAYHEEACEEASLIMVYYYLQNKKITPEIAEDEIQKIIAYQIKNYGDYMDSTAEEIVKLGSDFYGLKNLKVVYDFSENDIKKELAKGNPVIVPAAGQLLGNPNFTPPGPLYHALVLVGYKNNMIIANDPGTKRGEKYQYDINVLYNAIHDFTGDKNRIEFGRKAMIVIQENN
jgi:hypothetical protein